MNRNPDLMLLMLLGGIILLLPGLCGLAAGGLEPGSIFFFVGISALGVWLIAKALR
jgi:hypothetical protein